MHAAAMFAALDQARRDLTATGRDQPRSALARMALMRAQRAAEAGDAAAFTDALEDARYYDLLLAANPLAKRLADA